MPEWKGGEEAAPFPVAAAMSKPPGRDTESRMAGVTFRLEAPNISRNFAEYETKWALLFRFVSFRFHLNIWYRISFRFVCPVKMLTI